MPNSDDFQDTVDDLLLVQNCIARMTDPEATDAVDAIHQCLSSIHQRLTRIENLSHKEIPRG